MAGRDTPDNMRDNVFYCATAMDGVNVMNALLAEEGRETLLLENRARLQRSFERAEKKAQEEESLLRTLPKRVISFERRILPPDTWVPYNAVRYTLEQFRPFLDTKTLFALNWKFGGSHSRSRRGETVEELNALLDSWIKHADHEKWIQPMGIWGIFPCFSENDTLVVLDPSDREQEVARFQFDRVIGGDRKDTVSGAQYFASRDSGQLDAVGLQLSTSGPQVDYQINRFRVEGDSESCLLLQGLSDRVAEDMADLLHRTMLEFLNLPPRTGIRWSPGYPAITDTVHNRYIFELLHADTLLGVQITEAGEFSPTGTTAAIVCFHPDARYT